MFVNEGFKYRNDTAIRFLDVAFCQKLFTPLIGGQSHTAYQLYG